MNRFSTTAMVLTAAVCSIAAGRSASAQPDLRGRFNGFAEGNLPAVHRGDTTLDITRQRNGRFNLSLRVTDDNPSDLEGTVDPYGIIRASGISGRGDHILVLGRTRLMGDGSVRLMALLYLK